MHVSKKGVLNFIYVNSHHQLGYNQKTCKLHEFKKFVPLLEEKQPIRLLNTGTSTHFHFLPPFYFGFKTQMLQHCDSLLTQITGVLWDLVPHL